MQMKLTRKVALIAGAGRGLSRGIALAFARESAAARYPAYLAEEVSRGIIQYVKRTGEAVCIDDAGSDERFAVDPYLLPQQPKSIVCLPIVNQA